MSDNIPEPVRLVKEPDGRLTWESPSQSSFAEPTGSALPVTCEECDKRKWPTTQPLHGVDGHSLCWTHAMEYLRQAPNIRIFCMTTAACSNCQFWKQGKCLRFPPKPVSQTWSKADGSAGEYRECIESSVITVWPDTFPHEWCGEHKPSDKK